MLLQKVQLLAAGHQAYYLGAEGICHLPCSLRHIEGFAGHHCE